MSVLKYALNENVGQVSQEERSIFWEDIVSVILSKEV
jgi:hypothetical protein